MSPHRLNERALTLLPAVIFMAFALREIMLPGLYFDEVYFDTYAVGLFNPNALIRPIPILPDNALLPGGRFPVVGGNIYHSAFTAYVAAPIYQFLGFNVPVIRFYHALYGAVTAALLFVWLRPRLGAGFALLGAGLLAIDPTWVFTFRTQFFNSVSPAPFFLSALILFDRAERPDGTLDRARLFFAGLFYGFSCHLYFHYLLFGPALLLLLAWRWQGKLIRPGAALPTAAGAFVGVSPTLYALLSIYLSAGTGTLLTLLGQGTPGGMAWADRFARAWMLVESSIGFWHLPQSISGTVGPHYYAKLWVFALVLGAGSLAALKWRQQLGSRLLATSLVLAGGFTLLLPVFGDRLSFHHSASLQPVVFAAFAAGLQALTYALRKVVAEGQGGWMVRLPAVAAGIALAWISLAQITTTLESLRRTGGVGLFSYAHTLLPYDLMTRYPGHKAVMLDWGFALQAYVLSRGAIDYESRVDEDSIGDVLEGTQPKVYVLRDTGSDHWLFREAAARGLEPQERQIYRQFDGTPVFQTVTFARPGQ